MNKEQLKKKFKIFFEKHTNIRKLPFLMTVVIPKYECKGERVVFDCYELLEDEDYITEHLEADYEDLSELWESFMNDLPIISNKDAFYLFDDNNIVIVENNDGEVNFSVLDYSDKIWEMF